ncbi:MAG: class I tRNA ligase family protein, partial [Verrucomicrobia bacterium]|nr:class I tRNA ligase family protein [Verrucomicrobiota bacterium]
IVSNALLSQVSAKAGWDAYQIIRTIYGDELATLEYEHPFCSRVGRLFAGDDFVENSTGTGFVHIAPGHGLEDYGLGIRHKLPVYSPVDDEGCLARTDDLPEDQQMPARLVGKSVLEKGGKTSEANLAVLDLLKELNRLLIHEPYTHQYPHCWRSKTPVVFRAMDQWFIRIDHDAGDGPFRQSALREIDAVKWVPDWGINRIRGAVEGRPDWCISRQRSWGVPIPAFYDAQGQALLDARIIRRAADLIAEQGSNAWFSLSAAELWKRCRPEGWTGPEAVRQSTDTLDVWIDSGSSSRAVIAQRPALHGPREGGVTLRDFQADLYLEGSDQHRGWFQSSLLLSLAGNGAAPYRAVLTHGFMVDADREKISKSKQGQGGYEKPQTSERYVKDFGADVLRLWVASQDFRNDIVVSDERIRTVGETYRLLRNALRYQLSNLYDFQPAQHAIADENLTGLDRWILDQFSALEADVQAAYEAYEFHAVYQRVAQFAAVELSALYHDLVKDRLYTEAANAPRRRSTQTALHRLAQGLCQILSPILVFTSDEAWEFIPARPTASVHEALWRRTRFQRPEPEVTLWRSLFDVREKVLSVLEHARQSKTIGKALDAKVQVKLPSELLRSLQPHQDTLMELLNCSQLEMSAGDEATATALVSKADGAKCERCWHWSVDVGRNAAHPLLCARCASAIA